MTLYSIRIMGLCIEALKNLETIRGITTEIQLMSQQWVERAWAIPVQWDLSQYGAMTPGSGLIDLWNGWIKCLKKAGAVPDRLNFRISMDKAACKYVPAGRVACHQSFYYGSENNFSIWGKTWNGAQATCERDWGSDRVMHCEIALGVR